MARKTGKWKVEAKERIIIGDLRYLFGSSTQVEVVKDPNEKKPLCIVRKVAKTSKYEVGDLITVKRHALYIECKDWRDDWDGSTINNTQK